MFVDTGCDHATNSLFNPAAITVIQGSSNSIFG
jgi:hypothetical protein